MIRKKYLLCLLIVSVMFSGGCAGASDYDIDLPGNYSVLRTSAHEVTIAPKTSETGWGANVVPAEVTEVGWNDEYIIAKQVKGEKNHSFWIIQIDNGKITGPLNKSNLIDKKEEYGIPSGLTLKKVQELINN
ncbi:DUF3997 domain-containing protein [Sporosarcina sp. SAFN-010]|uniref:DUF3997 domain-containing protein n=1 Tax=Sporosarcina sp. SAFN-010 TaxID=3387273 RepID=UPI003F81556F